MKSKVDIIKILYLLLIVFVACGQKNKSKHDTLEEDPIQSKSNFRVFLDKTIFEDDTLNGKVKTITEYFYGENYDSSVVLYTFNEYGLQVRRKGFGQDISNYYKENKLIKSSICFEDNGKEYRKNEYLYDKKGNLISHTHICLPNERNKISDSTIIYYVYNNKNKLIEQKKDREVVKYQYDEFNDCVIEEQFIDNLLREKIENNYINHRLEEKITWKWFEGFGYYTKETYNYNSDGTMKSIINYVSNTPEFSKVKGETTFFKYTFDKENRLVKIQEIKNNYENTITFNNFDLKGNWQLKNINDNGRKGKIKRKIEYFE